MVNANFPKPVNCAAQTDAIRITRQNRKIYQRSKMFESFKVELVVLISIIGASCETSHKMLAGKDLLYCRLRK